MSLNLNIVCLLRETGEKMETKILFVKQFLAALCKEKIEKIPINTPEFKKGVQKMADYYHANKEKFGPDAEQLDMLFLKYTTRGEFSQFSRIIESFNGRIVSLENPHYVRANLKLDDEYVDELIDNTDLGIEYAQYQQLVHCFTQGISDMG